MRSELRRLWLAGILILTSACQREWPAEQIRQAAPSGPEDVGLVFDGADEDTIKRLLDKHPQAQVRVLNRRHGMFEIFNLAQAEVQDMVPRPVSKNRFIPRQPMGKPLAPLSATIPRVGLPTDCQDGTPSLKAEFVTPPPVRLKLGQSFTLVAQAYPDAKAAGFWIRAPKLSLRPEQTLNGVDLSLTPDMLGLYDIVAFVQDANRRCSTVRAQLIVSANPPQRQPKGDTSKLSDIFFHLAELHVHQAWSMARGAGVRLAVIDTGIDYNHIDLYEKMVPDLGYDFKNGDEFPFDDDGHGTFVGGLIAARFGVAPKVRLMAFKAMDTLGGDVASVAAAIRLAVDRHARVINLSLGGFAEAPDPVLTSAIAYAQDHDVLLVVAAGNGDPFTGLGMDIDDRPIYPASLPNENILTVGASDETGPLAIYSNFGAQSVDLVAPGGSRARPLWSAAIHNPKRLRLTSDSGTSMACPLVSGIAALLLSRMPSLSATELRQILTRSGPIEPDLQAVTTSSRRVDAFAALRDLETSHFVTPLQRSGRKSSALR